MKINDDFLDFDIKFDSIKEYIPMRKGKIEVFPIFEYRISKTDDPILNNFNLVCNYNFEGDLEIKLKIIEDILLQDATNSYITSKALNYFMDNINEIIKLNHSYYNLSRIQTFFNEYLIILNDEELNIIINKINKYNLSIIDKNEIYYYRKIKENNFRRERKFFFYKYNKNKTDKKKLIEFYFYPKSGIKDFISFLRDLEENIENHKKYLKLMDFTYFGIPIGYCNNIPLKIKCIMQLICQKIKSHYRSKSNKIKKIIKNSIIHFSYDTENINFEKIEFFQFIFTSILLDEKLMINNEYFYNIFYNFLGENPRKNFNIEKMLKNSREKTKNHIIYCIDCNNEIIINNKKLIFNNEFSLYNILTIAEKKTIPFPNITFFQSQNYDGMKNTIYNQYSNLFFDFLKLILTSNIYKTLYNNHYEFSKFEFLYDNKEIVENLFNNDIKFYSFPIDHICGMTEKNLLSLYISSYPKTFDKKEFYINDKEYFDLIILYNMVNSVIIFLHETHHYTRIYLYYLINSAPEEIHPIMLNTANKNYYINIYDENINLNYLKKFEKELTDNEYEELNKVQNEENFLDIIFNEKSELNMEANEYFKIKKSYEQKLFINNNNNDNKIDGGDQAEIQLFSDKLGFISKFNILQLFMILDEQAYNLRPCSFNYIFNLLNHSSNKLKIYFNNFRSKLIKNFLNNSCLTEKVINNMKSKNVFFP
jgi:hypothetical protein